MANKLAGQRAKFSRARALFYTTPDDPRRQRAAQLMAEVLAEAPGNGFTEEEVTQGEDVPLQARQLAATTRPGPSPDVETADSQAELPDQVVDTGAVREFGAGEQFVYAYGYACAPDRLKIGSCSSDVDSRIAAQISTGTPDKPALRLLIRTHDCRALERVLHGIFRLKGRQVVGAGAEWFIATVDEVVEAYEKATS